MKEIRKNLHKSHGVFQKSSLNKREKFLKEKNYIKILETNISTKERISFYEELYKKIFFITSKPKTILDLGCGLNPLSYNFMKIKNLSYKAIEINQKEVGFLNNYFGSLNKNFLKGEAKLMDLSEKSSLIILEKMVRTDVCFMFKLLESIELTKKRKYKLIESLLKAVNVNWLIISFPTRTISQKPMRFKKRKWFEAMLERIKFPFKILEFSNEVFYIIKKNKA